MTTSITPTAIDALVAIESVKVVDRHRKSLGDLKPLAESIEAVGLLHPVVLTRDLRLVAGQRRLEACRLLGWASVPARFVDNLDDAAKLLRAERDENTERRPMAPSELMSLAAELVALERPKAAARQGTRTDLQELSDRPTEKFDTRNAVAGALGLSPATYGRIRRVHRAANDSELPEAERERAQEALNAMDRTGQVWPVYRRWMEDTPEPAAAVDPSSPDWVPEGSDRSARAAARRRELIAQYATEGYSSRQIGERLGILDQTIRDIARQADITISADAVVGRTRRHDSNRIVQETVNALEGLAIGVGLVDYDDLDEAEIADWVASLTHSTRAINRLIKQMKEKTQ